MLAAISRRIVQAPVVTLWCAAGVVLAVASVWTLQYVQARAPVRSMTASVARGQGAPPLWTGDDASFDPRRLARMAGLDPREPFEVDWQGLLIVQETGVHRLRVRADDGAALWVNDRLLIDELTGIGEQHVMAPVELAPGLHPIRLRYVQRTGESLLRLSWQEPSSREEFRPLAVVAPSDPPPVFRRIDKALRYPRQLAVAWGVWMLGGLALAGWAWLELVARTSVVRALGGWQTVMLVVVASVLLGAHIDLGGLPWRGWAPDELHPRVVMQAQSMHFSGGWYDIYPPMPFYVLAVVHAPFELLAGFGWLSLDDPRVYGSLHILDRLSTLIYSVLTAVGVALLAYRTIGARAAQWAPYMLVGVPMVAFYSKSTNIDTAYTFWIVVAALAFTRALVTRGVAEHAIIGAAAAAAVATKDQAYGFFPGVAVVLLWLAWRDSAGRPWASRLLATIMDRPLWAGLITCVAVYSVLLGVWWNPEGVRSHVLVITGTASVPFRMFPQTALGLAQLAGTSMVLLVYAIGPVIALTAVLGLGVSISQRVPAREYLLLAFPLGYLVTFVSLIGFIYDRFLMGLLPFVALFAARGVDWALHRIPAGHARRACAAVIVAALLYPTVALNRRLATDSRFEAEAWMHEHLTDDPLVLAVGSALYLPNLYPYQHRLVKSASPVEILSWEPDAIVFNEDWFARPGQPSTTTVRRELTEAGYVEAFTTGPGPLPTGLLGVLASGLAIDPMFSNVTKSSPPISIWRKAG